MPRPQIPTGRPTAADRARAHDIVKIHGHDTLSYFALRDSGGYLFDETGAAFLSYKIWRNVALVGADPIGPPDLITGLTRRFLRFCKSNGLTPCFLGINGDNLRLYQAQGLRVLKIGEEGVLRLAGFDVTKLKRKVRRAERHCLALGIASTMFSASELPRTYADQAMEVSREWLRTRGGFERGFSMTLGRFPNADDADVRIVVAAHESELIGFLTFMPVYGAGGWSLDMMRRSADSPNGLTEFLVIQAARKLQAEGWGFISLNFAALANTKALVSEPRAVTTLRRFLFDNLSSTFQLKSLFRFNAKFQPEWVARYVAYRDLRRAGKIILAIIQAEDPITLPSFGGLVKSREGS
jgi:lysyl-tRNA synthetase, class II